MYGEGRIQACTGNSRGDYRRLKCIKWKKTNEVEDNIEINKGRDAY